MRRSHNILTTLTLALVLGTSTTAMAVEVVRGEAMYVGLRIGASNIGEPDRQAPLYVEEEGGGLELLLGYHFNQVFSLELGVAGLRHDTSDPDTDAEIGQLRLMVLYHFLPRKALRPYAKAGLVATTFRLESPGITAEAEGGGLALGGGLDYHFSESFSFGLDATVSIIEYDNITVEFDQVQVGTDVDEEGGVATLSLSMGFHF